MYENALQESVDLALAPLRDNAANCALFFDIDGTLAPIVERIDDARVPDAASKLLGQLAKRYALVACVSGRTAAEARRLVGVGAVTYAGSHGAEILRPGAQSAEVEPQLNAWRERVRAFARANDTYELRKQQVRIEDKGFISAFHWRGADDEDTAGAAVKALAERAAAEGFAVHWGRKVLEVRPPVEFHKGAAVRQLALEVAATGTLYVGDDATDADAFAALRELRAGGQLKHAVCIGVLSDECPAAIREGADQTVAGPQDLVALLQSLLR
ncbi:MAG: trehalose-phosphatase [Thermoleophilaceae bacterium]|nr:trehalose-phosphatase [Thermoleophilaceae bacterium]